jgi:hypothetical protein
MSGEKYELIFQMLKKEIYEIVENKILNRSESKVEEV